MVVLSHGRNWITTNGFFSNALWKRSRNRSSYALSLRREIMFFLVDRGAPTKDKDFPNSSSANNNCVLILAEASRCKSMTTQTETDTSQPNGLSLPNDGQPTRVNLN
ncbi:hypothetical protein CEXT_477981 [Caerostris extrusa]|uniref:Ycf15 n=1 Tax=Caerostris extrusa TaxID=172846 RepID=A0AAV4TLI9_CAEEX|nr:hypothetical protein CEXT_477981 [Caerostris extrusa]